MLKTNSMYLRRKQLITKQKHLQRFGDMVAIFFIYKKNNMVKCIT